MSDSGIQPLDRYLYLDPEVEFIEFNMPAYSDYVANNVADGNHDSFFWLGRPPRKGDRLTVAFKKPVFCSHREVITGKANTSQDILVEGELELSRDVKLFKKVSDFEYGADRVNIAGEIKAVRIQCISGQGNEWLIVRNICMKP